jgi:hypothetical protein
MTKMPDTGKTPKPDRDPEQEQVMDFRREVQKLIDAGELDPAMADDALDRLVRKTKKGNSA